MTVTHRPSDVSTAEAWAEPRAFRWTRDAYCGIYDAGIFDGRRVELIDGRVYEKPLQSAGHAWSIATVAERLRAVAGAAFCVRQQMPLNLSEWSDPEPDVAVVAGDLDAWRGEDGATTVVIVVEVSDTTLAFDRRVKQSVYAAAGLREYWIVNLVDRCLEVYRDPRPDAQNVRASRYAGVRTLSPQDVATPLAFPDARIAVADLLG